MDQASAGPANRHVARMDDGAEIVLRRWGESRPVRIVLSHGNGFAVDGYWAFGKELLREFEVIAFDLRNHGQSASHPAPASDWSRFIADIPQIFRHIEKGFGAKPTHGAFHSMSAASTVISQISLPLPWVSLTLFEPPIPPVADPDLLPAFTAVHAELARRTRKRRRRFVAPEELARVFRTSPSFAKIDGQTVDLLAQASLFFSGSDPTHPWELCRDPDAEASINDTSALRRHWAGLAAVETPIRIVLGDTGRPDMPELARSGQLLADTFGFGSVTVPGSSHLMQLERPKFCADLVSRFVRSTQGRIAAGKGEPPA